MIRAKNLSFSYGDKEVLHNIDMEIETGKVTAILGKNGSGKTTLFRCLLGISKNYSGTIEIDGTNIKSITRKKLSRLMAYIPQIHYPFFNYSVLEMVLMGTSGQIGKFASPGKKQYEDAERALERLEISYLADRDYCEISGGEQQLALIARALVQDSKILLLDEPTNSLDFGNQIRVMEQVKMLSKLGYTILMTSHNPQYVLNYADNMYAIKEGEVIAGGKADEVLTNELTKELYGVDTVIGSIEGYKTIVAKSMTSE